MKSSIVENNSMCQNLNVLNRSKARCSLVVLLIVLTVAPVKSLFAGGYVDGSTLLDAATAINTGTVSVTPTFNNDQLNNKVLVATVNNDQIKTPSTADPVSTVSGNNYHDETDFQIRGRNDLNYTFTRTYNSAASATTVDRGLGFGWVHSYGMRLESNDFGICPNCNGTQKPENINLKTSSITYTDERGGEQNFLVNETTFAVTNPKGVFDTLKLDSATGQHTLTFRNGVKYTFETPTGILKTTPNITARLKFIDNPWGDRLTLTYDVSGRLSTITDNLVLAGRTGLVFSYYVDNHLKNITDWTGRQWSYAYSGNDLITKTNPLSQSITYSYQTGHLLHEVIQPLLRNNQVVKTTFNYYRNGRAFNYYNALMQTETMDYDLYRKRTRVTDPRGGVREYNYDADGRMTKLIEPNGAMLMFGNQGDGLRYLKYDGLGYATQYSYHSAKTFNTASDNGGNVSREQDALGQTIDTSYGIYDQVATVKDKRGTVTTTSFYTAAGACSVIGKPQSVTLSALSGQLNSKLRTYCWNANGTPNNVTEYPNATGLNPRITQYTYETGSNSLNVSDVNVTGAGQSLHTHYTYDALGRKLTETVYRATSPTNTTQLPQLTTYQYDVLDRSVKVTSPDSRIRETVFDANGQIAQENYWYPSSLARTGCAAPIGGYVVCTEAIHQYDAADRRIATTDLLGNVTKFAYDEAGNQIKVTDANGHIAQYEYDAMNHKSAVINGNGQRTETKYDLAGNVVSVTNANGEITKTVYDALDRLTSITNPLGFQTQYKYDANGNQTCVIDANGLSLVTDPGHQPLNIDGCTESRSYDELNRVTQIKDAQNNITAYTYNFYGNRTALTDAAGHVTTFKYDDLGRMTEIVDPLIETPTDKTQLFVYDEAGNVIQATDRKGLVTQYTYDILNRNTQTLHLFDNSTESTIYDSFGDLIQSQNSAIAYTYAYTSKHQLKSKTDSRLNKTLSWSFDPVGNIQTKTDYQGDLTTYQYDGANRLVAESNPAYLEVSYHYDGAGRLEDRILSNGAHSRYVWDIGGRLTQLQNTTITGQLVNNTRYTRDRIGNILTQIETGQTLGTSFNYDPEYRLLSADYIGTANDEAYSYDKVGNRLIATQGALIPIASSRYYNYNAGNRMTDIHIGSTTGTLFESYAYDDNGSMTGISGNRNLSLTWDLNNRVSQINTNTFNYDPSNYRINKTGSAINNYYLEGENLEAVYNEKGSVQAQYLRGSVIDEIVNGYQLDATGKLVNTTYHHDALQSVLGQSGHEGSILAKQTYSAFGSILSQTGASNNAQKYTGREQDAETGFYYYRARYYDAVRGDFISEDPKGFGAGINFYAYANNNPINGNDPLGLFNILAGSGATAAGPTGAEVSGGIAINPGLFGQKADAGVFVAGGVTGGVNVSADVFFGVVKGDIGNVAGQTINQNIGIGPFSITLFHDPNTAELIGGTFGIGPGATPISYSAAADITKTFTIRDAMNMFTSSNAAANGGFVLYPNKSNTNMMQSVYKK